MPASPRGVVRRTAPLLALIVLATGCGVLDAPVAAPAGPAVPDTPLVPPVASPAPLAPVAVDWADGAVAPTAFVDGRTVRACEGDAPVLCVHDHTGALAGRVELGRWPVDEPVADPAAWLRAEVDAFVAGLAADRTATCGGDHEVSLVSAPLAREVDGAPALTYRYVVVRAGTELERGVTTLVRRPDEVLAISAVASDDGACVARDDGEFRPADLETFEAALDAIVRGSRLP